MDVYRICTCQGGSATPSDTVPAADSQPNETSC